MATTRHHPPTRQRPRTADFTLTVDELRAVTAFAVSSAAEVLPLFEAHRPRDPRPRDALEAATAFVRGEPRSRRQRVTASAAHRAAKEAASPASFHAAMAAGDAAASAYLHPLADVAQVNHILRASAHAIRAVELEPRGQGSADSAVEHAASFATPLLIAVLHRYPRVVPSANRVSRLVQELDSHLRDRSASRLGPPGSGPR